MLDMTGPEEPQAEPLDGDSCDGSRGAEAAAGRVHHRRGKVFDHTPTVLGLHTQHSSWGKWFGGNGKPSQTSDV